MKTAKLLLSVCTLMAAAFTSQAKGWRGIVPLHSTRADVERLLGKPNDRYGRYDFQDEKAIVSYQGLSCSNGAQWDVPPDTVISIGVYPKKALRLADLKLDPRKYKRVGDSYSQGRTIYWNEEEGIEYHVVEEAGRGDGKVMEIYYNPAASEAHHLCPAALEARQASDDRGLGGDVCPTITIIGPPGGKCRGQRCSISAQLSGLDPRFSPTFEWKVSAGTIVSGQGTYAIEIDMSSAGDKPVIVTLKVGGVIPRGCPNTESYTVEPAQHSTQVSRPASCRKLKKG
jgi:hypothetical protein